MLIPFICATFIAQRVGEIFNEGLYDIHNGLTGVPILPWNPPVGARLMSVSEFMTSPVVCFTERVRMREVWDALCFTCHNAFPVVRYPSDQGTRPYQKRFGKLFSSTHLLFLPYIFDSLFVSFLDLSKYSVTEVQKWSKIRGIGCVTCALARA